MIVRGIDMQPTVENLLDGVKVLESLIADYEEYLTQLHEDGYIDVVADGREYLISLEDTCRNNKPMSQCDCC